MEETLRFPNGRGQVLAGVLIEPEGVAQPPVVVFAHGWGSGKASPRNRALAEALVEAGLAALLFDFSGHGESEGSFEEATIEDQVGDLCAAVDLVEARRELGPIGIAGSSSGGAVAIEVALADPRVRALVLRAPSAAARLGRASRIEVPTLVIQGEDDPLLERNRELVRALACEHRLYVVSGAGHLFEEPGAFEKVARETLRWFRRWLREANQSSGGEARPGLGIPGESVTHFSDRTAAGRELGRRLGAYRTPQTLVLGLPRGGVAVAEPIALALGCDLDVIVSRKLRAPSQPELAIGAVAEGNVVIWNEFVTAVLGASDAAREWEVARARRELEERVATYRAVLPRAELKDRTVIVTDDGVATGATLKAAVEAIRREGVKRMVVALPGGPADTLDEIAGLPGVDEVVVLAVPREFWAVGQLYDSFAQVSTDEVCEILRRARQRRARG